MVTSSGQVQLDRLTEPQLLARCIWGEARGEPIQGKLAVAHVVLNRVKAQSHFGKTIRDVILKPWQFSCFNQNDPNLAKILGLNANNPDLAYCQAVADIALLADNPDSTGGATHYHSTQAEPSWASSKQMIFLCRIGNHLFYRESLSHH